MNVSAADVPACSCQMVGPLEIAMPLQRECEKMTRIQVCGILVEEPFSNEAGVGGEVVVERVEDGGAVFHQISQPLGTRDIGVTHKTRDLDLDLAIVGSLDDVQGRRSIVGLKTHPTIWQDFLCKVSDRGLACGLRP